MTNTSFLKNKNTLFYLMLLTSVLTIAAHVYLAILHYDLKAGLSTGQSLCNVSQTFNCDSVAASSYAQLFGIPMALLGIITQIVLIVFTISAHFELSVSGPAVRTLSFWLSGFVFFVSLVMGGLSTFSLGTFCLFCMATYLFSAAHLFFCWNFQETPPQSRFFNDLPVWIQDSRWTLILLVLIPAGGYIVNKSILSQYGMSKMDLFIQESVENWKAAPEFQFQPGETLVMGSTQPKMTIVEFADYLCPHCKMANPSLHAFTQAHSEDVQLIFKTFPLDAKCNKGLTHSGDGVRCDLPAFVICAEKIAKKGWTAHERIFEKQENLRSVEMVQSLIQTTAADFGISKDEIEKCLKDDSTFEAIQKSAAEGTAAKIEGTPTIFVNGKRLERGQALPVLEGVYNFIKSH